jgi:GT2 family glycosyltransferase/glycosyltransferase involved in cell wall biosynthesis
MNATIVVPVYNALEFARACIESIYRARTSMAFEVIVVDNGSSGDVQEWLAVESARHANFRFLRFEAALGFPRAVNEGARVARHDLLVVLNSDTLVYDDWLDMLASTLDQDRVALAGPMTNHCGHAPQIDDATEAMDPTQAREHATAIHHRAPLNEPQRLVFFCAMVRRSLWLELNGLDEAYSPGNFEDDDFCLRARLAGYRLAVARNVFVFHHSGRTFGENLVEHAETLARGQLLFCARAAAWSKGPPAAVPRDSIHDLVVIIPVPTGWMPGLRDSLASLANQTVTGFDVIVISSDHPPSSGVGSLPFQVIHNEGNLPALLNAGITAAKGRRVAFLPAGDVYFPFHLEILANAPADAAYTAWSVAAGDLRGVVRVDQSATERLHTGDWAPLAGWMHRAPPLFDESLDVFCGWDWIMRLKARPQYLPRVTCEKQVRACSSQEARRVMELHPVTTEWRQHERRRFLAAVESGCWERKLVMEQNPVERRARRMIGSKNPHLDLRELELAKARFTNSVPRPSAVGSKPAIVLFSIIHWTDLFQRPHHFARGLAARNHRVFWVDVRLKAPALASAENLTAEIEPGLHYLELPSAAGDLYQLTWHPAVLDAMEAAFAALHLGPAIQLVNFPKWTPLVLRLRDRFGWPIVYDCLDDQQAFGELHPGNEPQLEESLIRESAVVVTCARTLYQRHRSHPNTILIPNAADFDVFGDAASAGLLSHLPRPVIGFFGALSDWLDLDWIRESAARFPQWSFVYIGRVGFSSREMRGRWAEATSAPNIHVIAQQDLPSLAAFLAQFDVCTMPFRDLPITRSMNAVKIFEYLAAGKPVVARDLPETRPLADLGLIDVYHSLENSFCLLAQAVATGGRDELIQARRAFAAENTWTHRIDQITSAFGRLPPAPPRP